ncbi:tetratricopeptide repeat-containing glycosyltransferase family 2 protein [Priestia megaterium]|uniref:tetratricopeptide repeat-containing glycosyltransferase family 2 protein n=1 Tax=Priestia megaterium TaxID=1404 RepID=UPI000F12A644|nr:glycosyltransferase [Priestia megaterium]RMA95428.1 glycosyltransferase involved in cell wall biosynthesis [Priestia megaterium]
MKEHQSISISLCMIVKDEEAVIKNCLSSIQEIVDEIIVVDTGSSDETKKIIAEFTDFIYDFKWTNDFSAARNFAFSKAKKDYILWLDADDIITEENKIKLLTLKQTLDPNIDAVSMNYHLAFDENGNPSFISRRNRLVKRKMNFKWFGFVHEFLEVYGNVINSDIAITHKNFKKTNDRNLRIYEELLRNGKSFSPRDQYYYANECKDHCMYEQAIEWYQKFLDGGEGWLEDNIEACGRMADCYIYLKDWSNAIDSCINSFRYHAPRGETCCRLGFIYLQQNCIEKAISWYKLATEIEIPNTSPFVNKPCYTWLPHLQLCLCYSKLSKFQEAKKHNSLAASFVPDNPHVKHNENFLHSVLQ